mmetsp:Transcript_947/g.2448  ORF Transcript_947/g.2448 Transcript_947/m.2448 type:complete len:203 (-) Transcript_947:925-1533(-)
MRALLNHLAMVHCDNEVCVLNRAQAVRDDDGRALAVSHELLDRRLYHTLALVVKSRGSLVKQQDFWIPDERPRNANALALAAGETVARDLGVNALRQLLDKLPGVGLLECLDDRVFGWRGHAIGNAIRYVGSHGIGGQLGVLKDEAELGSEPCRVGLARVDSAECGLACRRVVESLEQADAGALARARLADEGDGAAALDCE